jgi:hypothetical protein
MAYIVHRQTGDTICICLDCDSGTVLVSHHAPAKPTQDSASLKCERQRQLFEQLVEMGVVPGLAPIRVSDCKFWSSHVQMSDYLFSFDAPRGAQPLAQCLPLRR